MRSLTATAVFGLGFLVLGTGHAFDGVPLGEKVPSLQLVDEEGWRHSLFEGLEQGDVLVVGFYSYRCPDSKQAWKRVSKLSRTYRGKPVRFVGISTDWREPLGVLRRLAGRADVTLYRDDGRLAELLGATTTPSVFVIDGTRQLRFRGTPDDSFDKALDAVLAGGELPADGVIAPSGCRIKR
jgi:peroxiredoxin